MSSALSTGIHVSGEATNPPVVLLHSSQSNSGQWRALSQQLESSYYVIAIDLLGYGKAPSPAVDDAHNFRFADELGRIVEAVKALAGDQPVLLVGHSYGGALALKLTLEQHFPVRALAVFEPVAFHVLDASDPARQEIDAIAEQMYQEDKMAATAAFVDYWNQPGYFSALPPKIQQLMASQAEKVTMDFAALMGEPHQLSDYADITVPVLLLRGSQTQASAKRVAEQLAKVLREVKVQDVDCGHMGPLTHAGVINPLLLEFIAQQHAVATCD
ncbi:Haloalkane dehalogenase [Pseudidiomarina piscicola]|uniref:Haloalkane dehalogenase n=1 Tax=Pseudidiomarina piscicola TaxID=2614830 RepID=A0A6S6WPU7_9GAMM|nr:alpha/beta hydrolase [Pseudidiomarina piscicola]CAB0149681.1 Haloalkane dehalogenase [Pseudidiomarina piscicola]VZT39130.1 Haloalkane dehalogenase [Pseudomonas aeruginosa]